MKLPITPCRWGGDTLYIGGIAPIANDRVIASGDTERQAQHVLAELKALLAANGLTEQCLVMVNVYLRDIDDFTGFNKIYSQQLSGPYPPRKVCQTDFSRQGVMVELTAIAGREATEGRAAPCIL